MPVTVKQVVQTQEAGRIQSIDIVRGLVMIIMALDHTRDFMHVSSLTQNPLDLTSTTPVLFFTRWITNFCAPVFVFLSGTSAYLSIRNRNDLKESRKFLVARGVWLILLEFTIINFAIWYDVHFRILLFQVIAAIGFGFIILSFLVRLPVKVLGITGLVLIFGHDLLSYIHFNDSPVIWKTISLIFNFTAFQPSKDFSFIIAYPVLPWFGMMLAGFAAGKIFELPERERKKVLLRIGMAALILFAVLRYINGYGDPSGWAVQKNGLFTLLSFVNTSKYPPSLLYSLMILGSMFLVLYLTDRTGSKTGRLLSVYGKVPFFYYLIHLYLVHAIMLAIMFLQGYRFSELSFAPFNYGRAHGSGISLLAVYLIWISVVVILYPICRWYGNYKSLHKGNRWLRYL